jgi:protein-S-isoprenylcysteine O-methyltransferase Ste14
VIGPPVWATYRVAVLVALYALVFTNLFLYGRHQRRFRVDDARPTYPISRLTRVFRPVMTLLQLGVMVDIPSAIFGWGIVPTASRLAIALCIGTAAVALLGWSLATLGEHFAPCYDARLPKVVVRSGPYRFTGHPIYLSNVALMGAFLLAIPNVALLALIATVCVFYAASIRDENRALALAAKAYPPAAFDSDVS